jgi:UDP-galactopyranose mutase
MGIAALPLARECRNVPFRGRLPRYRRVDDTSVILSWISLRWVD